MDFLISFFSYTSLWIKLIKLNRTFKEDDDEVCGYIIYYEYNDQEGLASCVIIISMTMLQQQRLLQMVSDSVVTTR